MLPRRRRGEHAHVGVEEEARAEPSDRVGAERVERHVAEVQKAGEADDDVEPERHHDVRERDDRGVHEPARRTEEERQHDHERDPQRDPEARPASADDARGLGDAPRDRGAPLVQLSLELAHPASLVSSPSRPRGRSTITRIR